MRAQRQCAPQGRRTGRRVEAAAKCGLVEEHNVGQRHRIIGRQGVGIQRQRRAGGAGLLGKSRQRRPFMASPLAGRSGPPPHRSSIRPGHHPPESGGRARTKTEFLQLLSRDEFEFRSDEIDDMEIRLPDNGRAALVTGRFRAEMQGANRLRGRYVRLWVLGPDGWRNPMQQSTEIHPLASQREAQAVRQ